MFGLGWPEVIIIGIVALLIFGPKKIPELGGALGKTLRGFKDEMSGREVDAPEEQEPEAIDAESRKLD
jgi:sec-independent protein translocase protein TatA